MTDDITALKDRVVEALRALAEAEEAAKRPRLQTPEVLVGLFMGRLRQIGTMTAHQAATLLGRRDAEWMAAIRKLPLYQTRPTAFDATTRAFRFDAVALSDIEALTQEAKT